MLDPPEPVLGNPPSSWSRANVTGITNHFLSLKKPSDVTLETLAQLNVTFQSDCSFETVLPSLSDDAVSHMPPATWLDAPDQHESLQSEHTPITLSNGRKAPGRKEFFVRARELLFKNEDAFSTLTRKATGGQAPLRLAHFRKFWEGLDNMAYYWDNSLDDYRPPIPEADNIVTKEITESHTGVEDNDQVTHAEAKTDWVAKMESGLSPPEEGEPRKKAKTESVNNPAMVQPVNANGFGGPTAIAAHTASIAPSRVLPARLAPSRFPTTIKPEPQAKPADLSNGSYRGYRIGNGAEMPDQYRIDCVRAFVEPIAWAFGVTLSQHRRPPVLLLQHVRFPVRMSSVAWRGPQDRMKARQGWMEGPVMGIQCRPDVSFGDSDNLSRESNLDTVRELGGLLLLAQERAREGKVERLAGEGKWWATKERWGGGPGGEVKDAAPGDSNDMDATPNVQARPISRNVDGSKARRRPTPAQIWKTVKPGNPLWDPKIAYEAIGKAAGAEWDDVGFLYYHDLEISLHVHRCLWSRR